MILSSFGGYETHGLAIDALAADWRLALDWLAELLFESVFPDDRLRWLARQAAAELEAQADQADLVTARAFAEQVYAPHPRGRPLQGDPASLARLDPERCREFHSAALGWGAYLSVAGEIDEAQVEARVGELFGELLGADERRVAGRGRSQPRPPTRRARGARSSPTPRIRRISSWARGRWRARIPTIRRSKLAAVLLGTGLRTHRPDSAAHPRARGPRLRRDGGHRRRCRHRRGPAASATSAPRPRRSTRPKPRCATSWRDSSPSRSRRRSSRAPVRTCSDANRSAAKPRVSGPT